MKNNFSISTLSLRTTWHFSHLALFLVGEQQHCCGDAAGGIRAGSLCHICQFHSPVAKRTEPAHWSSCCSRWVVAHGNFHSGCCVSHPSGPAGGTFVKKNTNKRKSQQSCILLLCFLDVYDSDLQALSKILEHCIKCNPHPPKYTETYKSIFYSIKHCNISNVYTKALYNF